MFIPLIAIMASANMNRLVLMHASLAVGKCFLPNAPTLEAPFGGECAFVTFPYTLGVILVATRPWEKKLEIAHDKRLKKASPRVS